MTTLNQARSEIYTKLLTMTSVPAANIRRENEKFEPPADAAWISIHVENQASAQESLGDVGNRKFERFASAVVEIHLPQNDGLGAGDTIAQEVRDLLEGTQIAGTTIRLNETEIRELGVIDGYYMLVAETAIRYTETR